MVQKMKIKKPVIDTILGLCQEAYPREIGGILLGKRIVDDFVLVPGQFSMHSIYIRLYDIPIYTNAAGTFHSHPAPQPKPSGADLDFFRRVPGKHLIVTVPYDLNSVHVYDSKGKAQKIEVVE